MHTEVVHFCLHLTHSATLYSLLVAKLLDEILHMRIKCFQKRNYLNFQKGKAKRNFIHI